MHSATKAYSVRGRRFRSDFEAERKASAGLTTFVYLYPSPGDLVTGPISFRQRDLGPYPYPHIHESGFSLSLDKEAYESSHRGQESHGGSKTSFQGDIVSHLGIEMKHEPREARRDCTLACMQCMFLYATGVLHPSSRSSVWHLPTAFKSHEHWSSCEPV